MWHGDNAIFQWHFQSLEGFTPFIIAGFTCFEGFIVALAVQSLCIQVGIQLVKCNLTADFEPANGVDGED